MKKPLILALAVTLGLGGMLATAEVASAHVPAITADCSGLVLHATDYDASQANVWSYTLGTDAPVSGTFGASYDATIPLPQGGATTHVVAHIAAADGSYPANFDQPVGPCGTPPPVVVPPQTCTLGAPYHESDDNAATVSDAGIDIRSAGDGKATDGGGYLVTGNAQGITSFDSTWSNMVGNGIFARLIFDLSADGGSAYNSFSGLGTHVDQSTVAGYGSKAVFTGKSLADVGTTWPHNKLVAVIWQTGSSYAAGDGALLTGFSGACGAKSFVVTTPPPTSTPTPTPTPTPVVDTQLPTTPTLAETGVTTGWLAPAALALLLLGAGAFTIPFIRRRRAARR